MAGQLGRRAVVGTAVVGGGVAAAVAAASPARARPKEQSQVRAAVLEHVDQWTRAVGLATLLRRAGVEVVELDPTRAPSDQGVDLVAFGSFTNNAATYRDYVGGQAAALRSFVAAGGVVLDLAQSDQLGATRTYLPEPMTAVNADPDHDTVHPTAPEHPLVAALRRGTDGRVLTDRDTRIRTSWETLVAWRRMRVLLAVTAAGSPPALLEGTHGAGRFLVSSLTVDKCFDTAGTLVQTGPAVKDSESFFAALAGYVVAVRDGSAPAVVPTPMPTERATGPMVGHVTTSTARIWLRPGRDHRHLTTWRCEVSAGNGPRFTAVAEIEPDRDHTVVIDVGGLRAATRYRYVVTAVGDDSVAPLTGSFSTATPDTAPARVVMGLGSCAPSAPNTVWDRIVAEGCDSFVMLGDTPYVDSTDLTFARTRHREFLQQPELARMIASMPVWATWDDHDFGGNDVAGDLAGKENTRRAFVDHRAQPQYGHDIATGAPLTDRADGEGIYCSFRRGPIEVFLLDPRWFSRTEQSWADPSRPTCLGRVQWEWLQQRLLSSTAPFKVLASGMIWDDKENAESDDWGTYAHERDAIYDFVRDRRIPGVVLLSGDIHVSRALNYGDRVGYDLWQYIVSPLHDRTIPSLNVPNPALVHSAVEPHVFLKLVADTTVTPATLTATWINREGRRIFEVARTADDLGHVRGRYVGGRSDPRPRSPRP